MNNDFLNFLVATDSLDSFLGKKIKLTNEHIMLFKKYSIDYNVDSIDKLLFNIKNKMNSFIYTKDYDILEKLYNSVYKLNNY